MMPTRYTLDVDLRTLFSNDVLAERKRQKETCQVCCSGNVIDYYSATKVKHTYESDLMTSPN